MNYLLIIFAIIGYMVTVYSLFKGGTTSVLTWLAWGFLDLSVLLPTMSQGDNSTALSVYTVGSLSIGVISLLLQRGSFTFGVVEKYSIGLAAISFTISLVAPPLPSIAAGTFCLLLVGLPLLVHIWKSTSQTQGEVVSALCFFVAALCSVAIAIETRSSLVFPLFSALYSTAWSLLCIRKYNAGKNL